MFTVISIAWLVLIGVQFENHQRQYTVGSLIVIAVILVPLAASYLMMRVEVDSDRLVIKNFVRRYRIPRDQVLRADAAQSRDVGSWWSGPTATVYVTTNDGRRIRAYAITGVVRPVRIGSRIVTPYTEKVAAEINAWYAGR